MKMPTSENTKDENNKRDDGYDIEYYERTGGNQGAEISDIKRDIHNMYEHDITVIIATALQVAPVCWRAGEGRLLWR